MKNHEKDNFESINKIMLPKDYLVYRLTKNFVSDVSDLAGTLFLNVDYSSIAQFNQDASLKLGLQPSKQREILKKISESDSELADAYQKKREVIDKKISERIGQATRERAREKLEMNIRIK